MKLYVHRGKSVFFSSHFSYSLLLQMYAFVREIHLHFFLSSILLCPSFILHSFHFCCHDLGEPGQTFVNFSVQRKRLSVLKPAIHLSVYVEKPWCLFLLTDAEVSTRKKTFAEVQAERLDQAERTVLIKCPSKLNEKKLLQYLSSHGNVKSHFFFENRVSN